MEGSNPAHCTYEEACVVREDPGAIKSLDMVEINRLELPFQYRGYDALGIAEKHVC